MYIFSRNTLKVSPLEIVLEEYYKYPLFKNYDENGYTDEIGSLWYFPFRRMSILSG